jgi:hypothetical protein
LPQPHTNLYSAYARNLRLFFDNTKEWQEIFFRKVYLPLFLFSGSEQERQRFPQGSIYPSLPFVRPHIAVYALSTVKSTIMPYKQISTKKLTK